MTVASLLTGPSRAAVATISVRGPNASELVLAGFDSAGPAAIEVGQVRYGIWHGGDRESVGESVVVSRNNDYEVDRSRAQNWELHCHGGAVAASRILDDLKRLGADVVDPWMLGDSASQAEIWWLREATEVLARTVSVRTAAIALDQVRGAMAEFVSTSLRLVNQTNESNATLVAGVASQSRQILRFASVGLHLTVPWRVVLAGPPNVGKSSLINALLGYRRSITVDMPGTTRDVLEAQTVIDGWPVRLSDTAGIRNDAESAIETAGIESARRELETADLILWVIDASETSNRSHVCPSEFLERKTIQVFNKIDRLNVGANDPTREPGPLTKQIKTSATTGVGIEELRLAISNSLVPDPPPPNAMIPITPRQVSLLQELTMATNCEDAAAVLRKLGSG